MSVEFIDPPSTSRGRGSTVWQDILDELRQHPGQWARVYQNTSSNSYATLIKQGKTGGAKPGEFEATVRSTGENEQGQRMFDVYARYVGSN